MTFQEKNKCKHGLFTAVFLITAALLTSKFDFLGRLEQTTLDFRYRYFNRDQKASDKVVVVDIDEQSLKLLSPVFGRWPWPRRVYKELLGFLSIGEPKAILFDILFSEKHLDSAEDEFLASATHNARVVSHAMNLLVDSSVDNNMQESLPPHFAERFGVVLKGETPPHRNWEGNTFKDFVVPNPVLLKQSPKVHVVTFAEDPDGVFRRAPLFFRYGNTWLPSLSSTALLSHFKNPSVEYLKSEILISHFDGVEKIPVDETGNLQLHYYRDGLDPVSIPFAAVIAAARQLQLGEVLDPENLKVSPLEFKDKIILIGTSAVGLEDLKTTSVHSSYPGVKLHATAIANVLDNCFLYRLPAAFQVCALLILILLVIFSVLFGSPTYKIILPLLGGGSYTLLAIVLFRWKGIWVDMAAPGVFFSIAYVDVLAYLGWVEGRQRKKLEATLSKYLSPIVTNQLLQLGIDPRAEIGRQEEITVLFADIRGFSSISEKHPPEEVVRGLNQYLGKMTEIVFLFGGTLDKFIGDAIMAFWGAPLKDEEHAIKATRCALEIQTSLQALRQERRKGLQFHVGIGLSTGRVLVGNIGSERRLDYTIIGDNVNLGSRLENLTRIYQVPILLSEKTQAQIKDQISCRLVDCHVQVRGKLEYTDIYEPLGESTSQFTLGILKRFEGFEEAVKLFHSGDTLSAFKRFEQLNLKLGDSDGLTRYYLERCRKLLPTENTILSVA